MICGTIDEKAYRSTQPRKGEKDFDMICIVFVNDNTSIGSRSVIRPIYTETLMLLVANLTNTK